MKVIPLTLNKANEYIAALHRHHAPVIMHRYSIGAVKNGQLVGVAIMNRPCARACDLPDVIEVSRVATNGCKNACSFLLGAAARIAKEMGFRRIQTYTLTEESGSSLKGAGWVLEYETKVRGTWKRNDHQKNKDAVFSAKYRWAKTLNEKVEYEELEVIKESKKDNRQPMLFDLS